MEFAEQLTAYAEDFLAAVTAVATTTAMTVILTATEIVMTDVRTNIITVVRQDIQNPTQT